MLDLLLSVLDLEKPGSITLTWFLFVGSLWGHPALAAWRPFWDSCQYKCWDWIWNGNWPFWTSQHRIWCWWFGMSAFVIKREKQAEPCCRVLTFMEVVLA